jgi:hypothetical protein
MDYLMWIGNQHYSKESYIKEATKFGASKKVGYIPHGLEVGKSKIYLISDMTEQERVAYFEELKKRHSMAYFRAKEDGKPKSLKGYGVLPRGQANIFGFFTVNAVIFAVPEDFVNFKDATKGISYTEMYTLKEGEFGTNEERGCGSLKPYSLYLISEHSMVDIIKLHNSPDLKSENVTIFDKPLPFMGRHFRGVEEAKE